MCSHHYHLYYHHTPTTSAASFGPPSQEQSMTLSSTAISAASSSRPLRRTTIGYPKQIFAHYCGCGILQRPYSSDEDALFFSLPAFTCMRLIWSLYKEHLLHYLSNRNLFSSSCKPKQIINSCRRPPTIYHQTDPESVQVSPHCFSKINHYRSLNSGWVSVNRNLWRGGSCETLRIIPRTRKQQSPLVHTCWYWWTQLINCCQWNEPLLCRGKRHHPLGLCKWCTLGLDWTRLYWGIHVYR